VRTTFCISGSGSPRHSVVARLGMLPGTPYYLELQHMRDYEDSDGLQFWQHPVMLAPQRLTDDGAASAFEPSQAMTDRMQSGGARRAC
jgi:hypothetical protein